MLTNTAGCPYQSYNLFGPDARNRIVLIVWLLKSADSNHTAKCRSVGINSSDVKFREQLTWNECNLSSRIRSISKSPKYAYEDIAQDYSARISQAIKEAVRIAPAARPHPKGFQCPRVGAGRPRMTGLSRAFLPFLNAISRPQRISMAQGLAVSAVVPVGSAAIFQNRKKGKMQSHTKSPPPDCQEILYENKLYLKPSTPHP